MSNINEEKEPIIEGLSLFIIILIIIFMFFAFFSIS